MNFFEDDKKVKVDSIIYNGTIITMNKDFHIFKNGAIAILGDNIEDIGQTNEILEKFTAINKIDLKGAIVHPGFINSHYHLVFHIIKCWIPDYYNMLDAWPLEKSYLSNLEPEIEYLSTSLACIEMALSGTTTFMDIGLGEYIESQMSAIESIGIRGNISKRLADGDIFFSMPTDKCLKSLEDNLKNYGYKSGKNTWCVATVYGINTCSDELMIEAKKLADKYNTILSTHLSFAQPDIEAIIEDKKKRPVEYYNQLGILDNNTTLTHLNLLSENELEIVMKSRINAVHCPEITMRYGLGYSKKSKFPEMVKSGINVGLGIDCNQFCSNSADINKTMRVAALSAKEGRETVDALNADDVLKMATIFGAKVMNIDKDLGSLEVGKKADIVIRRIDRPENYPSSGDLIGNLVYSMGPETIKDVLVGGKFIVKDSKLQTIDPMTIYEKIDVAAKNLKKKLGYSAPSKWPVL